MRRQKFKITILMSSYFSFLDLTFHSEKGSIGKRIRKLSVASTVYTLKGVTVFKTLI